MRDILKDLYEGEISEDEAYDIMDEVVECFHTSDKDIVIPDELGLDIYEWTAICQALSLGVLARWRCEGWPTVCYKCGSPINYKEFGWIINNDQLKCLKCPSDNPYTDEENMKDEEAFPTEAREMPTVGHCCNRMKKQVEYRCDIHPDPFDCPDNLIHFGPRFQDDRWGYGIIIHDGTHSYVKIEYCPWCGKKLTAD